MSQADNVRSGSYARSDTSAAYFAAGLLIALFALSVTIAPPFLNTDDLFYGAWAGHFGKTGHMWAPNLARAFPDRTEILIYPPLHMAMAGLFFRYAGFTAATADFYTSVCSLLTSLGCMLVVVRLGLGRAVLAAAPIGFLLFSFSGLRPEVTSGPLFAIGLGLLLGGSRAETFAGRTLLFLAPTAAPTVLGPAAAALAVFTLREIWIKRKLTPIIDSFAALAIATIILGLPIGFRYADLISQVGYHYSLQPSNVELPAIVKGLIFFAATFIVWRRSNAELSALALGSLGLGVFLGMMHSHAGTSILRDYLGIVIFVAAMSTGTRWAAAGVYVVLGVGLLIYSSLPVFWITSKRDLASDERTRDAVRALRDEGRTLLVDDISAKYLYDYDIEDKISWHWASPFPAARPTSLADLRQNDLWVVSRVGLLGYLRGDTPFAKYLNLQKAPYEQAPMLPCVMGRMSCRLPARRFDYVLFWRDKSGQAYVQDLIADPEPRPIS